MNNSLKNRGFAAIIALVAIALSIGAIFIANRGNDLVTVEGTDNLAAIGTKLPVENYIPVIKYNDGYYSTLDITTTGAFTTATISASGAVTLSSTLDVAGATIVDEFTQGGTVLSTSTESTAMVFTASDLLTNSIWEVTPDTADLTYTFPASTTLSAIVPSAGDSRTWIIVNATSTAAIDVIFAAGTGSAIKGSCGGGLTLDEDSHGTLTVTRKANSDLVINTCFPTAD